MAPLCQLAALCILSAKQLVEWRLLVFDVPVETTSESYQEATDFTIAAVLVCGVTLSLYILDLSLMKGYSSALGVVPLILPPKRCTTAAMIRRIRLVSPLGKSFASPEFGYRVCHWRSEVDK